MALPQEKMREMVFQLLFSDDFSLSDEKEMTRFMMSEYLVAKSVLRLANEKKMAIQSKLESIDVLIKTHSDAYAFERISRIERNILRLSLYELFFSDLPHKIALAEGIRLARKFASPEGAKFVNAILDKIYKEEHATAIPDPKTVE